MAEPTEHGLVLHLNLPVRKQATGGRVDLDLSQVDRTRFIETRERDENQELVEYVKKERSLQERREQRMDAPVWLRTKWWALGKGDS